MDKLDGDGKSALKKAQRSLKDLLDDLLELQVSVHSKIYIGPEDA